MDSIPPENLAQMYDTMAPMFDEAYAEQGLEGEFRKVVLEAVNTLLATPDIDGPLTLKRPTVMECSGKSQRCVALPTHIDCMSSYTGPDWDV